MMSESACKLIPDAQCGGVRSKQEYQAVANGLHIHFTRRAVLKQDAHVPQRQNTATHGAASVHLRRAAGRTRLGFQDPGAHSGKHARIASAQYRARSAVLRYMACMQFTAEAPPRSL